VNSKSPSHSSTETRVLAISPAMLTLKSLRLSQLGRLGRPACFSTKAWYAAFLLSRNITIGPVVCQAALTVFQQKPGMQLFFFRNPHQLCSVGLRSHAIIENTQQRSAPIWVRSASLTLSPRHRRENARSVAAGPSNFCPIACRRKT
jgi:hypothetical protein